MGLRLRFLAWWTPSFFVSRELDYISRSTTVALRSLLAANPPSTLVSALVESTPRTVEKRRTAMAREHTKLVDALVERMGPDEAVKLGRATLFKLGTKLGEETRHRLGVGETREDLIRAARILYLILGINFTVQWLGETSAVLVVNHCELAREYSELTCLVLSAIDEGVIQGMNPAVKMAFRERMTSGCSSCRADIEFTEMDVPA